MTSRIDPPIEGIRSVFMDLFPGRIDAEAIRRLTKGHGHESWIVPSDGRTYLLKIAVRGANMESMRNLREAIQIANVNGVASPKLLHFGESEDLFEGRAFLVQEFLDGQDGEEALHHMTSSERERYFKDFGETVARMHAIHPGGFSHSLIQVVPGRSWPDVAGERLDALIAKNQRAEVLSVAVLDDVVSRIRRALRNVSPALEPGLTHRDLYPPNTLVHSGRFRCLLDFEHAKFYDPLFDFVKLEMWVFEKYQGSRSAFLSGYEGVARLPDDFEERKWLCFGLELLAGFPYWKRYGNLEMLSDYQNRIGEWLE